MLFPPLGAASLASQLKSANVEVRIFDCTFKAIEEIQDDLSTYQPGIVGIYSMVTLSKKAFELARWTAENIQGALIVAGGPLPTLFPERFMNDFDAVFCGEADLSFPQFCRDYFDGRILRAQINKLPLQKYPGLFVHKKNLRIQNQMVHFTEQFLAEFPLPYRGDFDHSSYQRVWQMMDGSKTTSLMTTFGCSFDCDFCSKPIFGSRFRRRSLERVLEEIQEIIELGYDTLWIADDNFTLDPNYLEGFCERIKGQNLKWSCLSRVTGIDNRLVEMMKSSGCKRVYLGLETGDAETLKLMKKRATIEDGKKTVSLFHDAGIEVAAFFIVGYPGETVQSIERTFKFALDLPLDNISFNVPYPLPGSNLFNKVNDVDLDRDWNAENETTFVYDSEFDSDWLRARISDTMQKFSNKGK